MSDITERLLRKIRFGEDSFLEYEEVVLAGDRVRGPGREQLADALAAFANAVGGLLILGGSDKTRQVTGILLDRLDAVERYVTEIANDSIHPLVLPVILARSRRLSGRQPVYELFGDELRLTIFAVGSEDGGLERGSR